MPKIDVIKPVVTFKEVSHIKLDKVINDPAITIFNISFFSVNISILCLNNSLRIKRKIIDTIALVIEAVSIWASRSALSFKITAIPQILPAIIPPNIPRVFFSL